jgi:DNA-binding FrmR family transcriptional regulator
MPDENRTAMDELTRVRGQISGLISVLDDQCRCFEALVRIRRMEGRLDFVILHLIQHELHKSIASIEGKPAPHALTDDLKHLVALFRIFCTRPVYSQHIIDKVKHE